MEVHYPNRDDPFGPIVIGSDISELGYRRHDLLEAWNYSDWIDLNYIDAIRFLLSRIFGDPMGQCVWDEIIRSKLHLSISPYFPASQEDPTRRRSEGIGVARDPWIPADHARSGTSCGRVPGPISDLHRFRHPASCLGLRMRGIVRFTPWWYPPEDNPSQELAGERRDEVLLHEIVHALRQGSRAGHGPWHAGEAIRFDDGRYYDYLDEFFAILVTNYFSAHTQRPLRRDHQNYHRMDEDLRGRPEEWLYNPSLGRGGGISTTFTNMELVNLFIRQQGQLAQCLADKGRSARLRFNPIDQLNR